MLLPSSKVKHLKRLVKMELFSQDNGCHFLCVTVLFCFLSSILCQLPEKTEPALADKEIIMAALNIKSMNFGSNFLTGPGGEEDQVRDT